MVFPFMFGRLVVGQNRDENEISLGEYEEMLAQSR
jgi:hypothetical protein